MGWTMITPPSVGRTFWSTPAATNGFHPLTGRRKF
jgi:hypothetical protein